MQKLIVERDGTVVNEAPLTHPTVFGRRSACTVQLDDRQISREHAVIEKLAESFYVRDLGSANGTFVNGQKLEPNAPRRLEDGDTIAIHPFAIRVSLPAATESQHTMVPPASQPTAERTPTSPAAPQGAPPSPEPVAAPASAPVLPAPNATHAHLIDGRDALGVWDGGETRLRVAAVIDETHDVRTFRLVGTEPMSFNYKPGQFLQIAVPIDGKEVKRSYSISSTPSRPHAIELTIKRCPNGLVSNWMNDNAKVGDEFTVKGPKGKFTCVAHDARKLFLLPAGSGVTPTMSMLRWLTDTSADVDVVMLYSVRSPADVVFGRELEYLAARHQNVRVIITSTTPYAPTWGWTGICKRADRDLIAMAAPDIAERHVYMCGPKPFADAMQSELAALGHPKELLFQESFGGPPKTKPAPRPASTAEQARPAPPAPPPAPAPPRQDAPQPLPNPQPEDGGTQRVSYDAASPPPSGDSGSGTETFDYSEVQQLQQRLAEIERSRAQEAAQVPTPAPAPPQAPAPAPPQAAAPQPAAPAGFSITFARSGTTLTDNGTDTLLEQGEAAGLELDSSCCAGQCGTCAVKLLAGTVEMEDNEMTDDERASGQIFLCVSRPTSDVQIEA